MISSPSTSETAQSFAEPGGSRRGLGSKRFGGGKKGETCIAAISFLKYRKYALSESTQRCLLVVHQMLQVSASLSLWSERRITSLSNLAISVWVHERSEPHEPCHLRGSRGGDLKELLEDAHLGSWSVWLASRVSQGRLLLRSCKVGRS